MGIESNNRSGSGAAYSRFAEEMDIDSVNLSVRTTSQKSLGMLQVWCVTHWKTLIVLLIALLTFGIGIIVGHFLASACYVPSSTNGKDLNDTSCDNSTPTSGTTSTQSYLRFIDEILQKNNLQSNLQFFTSGPHYAGSSGNREKAKLISDTWNEYGFTVSKRNYTVMLSRPDSTRRNKLEIVSTSSSTPGPTTSFVIDDLDVADTEGMLRPFAVYGSNASITNKPVYVNYARTEDFNDLRDKTAVAYEGYICIARLGKIPLAQMAQISRNRKCLGLIAFPDPHPYAPLPPMPQNSYPYTWWLPQDGVPRESARLNMGDPTSPFFPSHGWTPRQPPDNFLADFPVQTISYDTAKGLLRIMKNPQASDPDWIGGLPEGTYCLGPGFSDDTLMLNFEVYNSLSLVDITNVIAVIEGAVEPDRYVIIGNHRDSLTYGVVSPGTGTACLMEVSRILSELMKKGWKPRRTVILASWDAGEDGSIGSTEFVEENIQRFRSSGVAYINLDDAVSGNYSFAAAGSPLLTKVIMQATQNVTCPDQSHSSMSIHDNWAARRPINGSNKGPRLDPLGVSSDSAPFLLVAGVPSLDLRYTYDEEHIPVPRYPTYGTAYDREENINVHIDPDYAVHKAVTTVAAQTLVMLADTPKLPMDVTHYAQSLKRYREDLRKYDSLLNQNGISLDRLEETVFIFTQLAQNFQQKFDSVDNTDELTLRELNDHILLVERAFLASELLQYNQESRHMIYGPSVTASYKGAAFSPLVRAIITGKELENWNPVEDMIGYTILAIKGASDILSDGLNH